MTGEPQITVVGNLTADPELRYTSQSTPVVSFTVASTPRAYNRSSGQWEDGTALFIRCSAWRDMAENVNESLSKGMRVIVTGRLVQRNWEQNGQNRSTMEIQVDEVGPSLRYAQAQVTRMSRGGGNFGGGNNFSGNQSGFQQGGSDFGGGYNQGGDFGGNAGGQDNSFGDGNAGSGQFGGPQNGSSDDPWGTGSNSGSSYDDQSAPPF